MKAAPSTKAMASLLASVLLQASVAWAVSIPPGSLAVLEPPLETSDMRAAWDGMRRQVYLDPLILVRGRADVQARLEEWSGDSESILSSYRTAERSTLEQTGSLLEEAWDAYYAFAYGKSAAILDEAQSLLLIPGDSRFRTRLMFEVLILRGLAARAQGRDTYVSHFREAAALQPARSLPSEKYSPETVSLFNSLKKEVLPTPRITVSLDGAPEDAVIYLGDEEAGRLSFLPAMSLLPGRHFVTITAPGYEPFNSILDSSGQDHAALNFRLVPSGPVGDPDTFFLRRLRAGDHDYMALLAEKLDVDYVLIPEPGEEGLWAWLMDRDGRIADRKLLWEEGMDPEEGLEALSAMLAPIRHQYPGETATSISSLALPPPAPLAGEQEADESITPPWKKVLLAVGILAILGAATASEGKGGTTIEATW